MIVWCMFNLCINIDIDQQGQSFEKTVGYRVHLAKKLGWLAQKDCNQKVCSFFFWKQPNELITQMQEMIKNCVHILSQYFPFLEPEVDL